ncbi:hypothetical protein VJJ19_07565, partial [Parvimonas sp. D4]|uniref:hypothetical protein n=1 Tax=Parvimonas sp. D4 TaxID=3110690 RepID=UPI002B467DB7
FPGVIRTWDEKLFKLPDGRRMRVPIINGYVPEINEKRVNGIIHRKFTFDTMTKYTGQTEFTNTPLKPPAVVTPPVQPPVLPPVPIPVQPPP